MKRRLTSQPAERPTKRTATTGPDLCSICFDLMQEGNKVLLTLPCKHVFHESCVHRLRQMSVGSCPPCPLCRHAIPSLPGEKKTPARFSSISQSDRDVENEESFDRVEEKDDDNDDIGQENATLPRWSVSISEKLPLKPYLLSNEMRTATVVSRDADRGCGMWVLTSSKSFQGSDKCCFRVTFSHQITYMAVSVITDEERRRVTTKDYGSDFSRYPSLEKAGFAATDVVFQIDMARRVCTIFNGSSTKTLRDLPERVWLACTMKTGNDCACTISEYNK